ncbi:hypothetical protein LTR97_006577 [Elasticomyces elasticus]|uniref:cAMP-dependent protein kinase regulatory subunit n=1 Tax=Elasticomyces elasticus TaxID=574655 RepID=A0AAN7W6I8_9PEZI|nr:hypothetical protein LTR97_006577 [Elasticomyces elasticus]
MSSLPPDYTREIAALEREVLKQTPTDILQFCSDFFHRRLSSQRAEFHLQQRHHSGAGGMAESSFPGSNPFGSSNASTTSSSNAPAVGGGGIGPGPGPRGMHSVAEEEEHDFASPTQSSFPPNLREHSVDPSSSGPTDNNNTSTANGGPSTSTFGNFSGFGAPPSTTPNPTTSSVNTPPPLDSNNQSFPTNYNMNRRTSVSAESLAPASASDSTPWTPPSYPKTQDQLSRLRASVSHNFLFTHLSDDATHLVLSALQERKIPVPNLRIIVQGDAGDYFYVVESGNFAIYVNPAGHVEAGEGGLGRKVADVGPGGSFGELALMYNAPRAATVVSEGPGVLWQLDRGTFRRIIMDSAFQRRRMYESFLTEVPLLSSLTPYERSKIADALETTKYPANTTIIREGDQGDKFYLLEAGEAVATNRSSGGKVLKEYGKGDYFGELALLDDRPRAASVVARTEVKVATLGKDGFTRLLGSVEGVMRREDPRNLGGLGQGGRR